MSLEPPDGDWNRSLSPRPAVSRDDATARQFLKAATQLIDAYLDDQAGEERPARLRSIHFPAALEWLRTEDVIRMAAGDRGEGQAGGQAGNTGPSRKAFFNRWRTREEFLPDALVYALAEEEVDEAPNEQAQQVPQAASAPVPISQEVIRIADGLLESLQRHPRSYLTLHIGPLLTQHPALWEALMPAMRAGIRAWADGYAAVLTELGVVLRPGWTPHRLSLALQAALDGFLLRYRIMPDDYQTACWEGGGIFADTVLAVLLGVIDVDRSGTNGREALDRLVAQ
jgi:AcrR family transcriptional regulator